MESPGKRLWLMTPAAVGGGLKKNDLAGRRGFLFLASALNGQKGVIVKHGHQNSSNLATEPLARNSFQELAIAVRSKVSSIHQRWEELASEAHVSATATSRVEVWADMPEMLRRMADAIESADPSEIRSTLAWTTRHGIRRFREGHDIQHLLTEYELLRRAVIEAVEVEVERRISSVEDVVLNMCVDEMLRRSVVAFVKRKEKQIQRATEIEARFLVFLSHDLRANLNAMSMSIEELKQLLRGHADVADAVGGLESIRRTILDTVSGMGRLLQAERVRKEVNRPRNEQVNLHSLAIDTAREFSRDAEHKGLSVRVEVPPEFVVYSDREWLLLVVQNLLANAVKYSSGGTIRIGITRETNASGRVTLFVSDQGPGISDGDLKHIFAESWRGQTHGQPGAGLGLAIAAKAARLLNAVLAVQSKPGEGSTFYVTLPRQLPQSSLMATGSRR